MGTVLQCDEALSMCEEATGCRDRPSAEHGARPLAQLHRGASGATVTLRVMYWPSFSGVSRAAGPNLLLAEHAAAGPGGVHESAGEAGAAADGHDARRARNRVSQGADDRESRCD